MPPSEYAPDNFPSYTPENYNCSEGKAAVVPATTTTTTTTTTITNEMSIH